MSNFERFRNFQAAGLVHATEKQKEFLTKSKSSRTVLHLPVNEEITAVLTNSYKEGGDEFIMFTEYLVNGSVIIGDYIEYDGNTFLVYNEYNHPMKNLWLKHQLIECNQVISFGAIQQPVYYASSLRRFVDNSTSSSDNTLALSSGAKPILVTRDDSNLEVNLRFMITDEAFSVVEIDRKSNPGIAYISIEPTAIMSQDDVVAGTTYEYPEVALVTDGEVEGIPGIDDTHISGGRILAGSTITEITVGGVINFSSPVKVLSRTATLVTWQAPMKEELITVTVSDGAQEVQIFYEVVI